ncbi:unnamed protein product [Ilex paraguariensis]|uniref:Uncharacterized protein n=1 Tax=Ilex paraguariensis TaxID=185542 RepID=A0ABC8RBG2_9AQUA
MESPQSSIKALVKEIKEEMFSNLDLYSIFSPSAYDTACLAMIPDPGQDDRPMFKNCLNWILDNQKEEGFWGESNLDGVPSIETLPTTLACMVTLKTWSVGEENIEKGARSAETAHKSLAFLHANTGMLVEVNKHHFPHWITIVFPAMVELAQATGLELLFPDELKGLVSNILLEKHQFLKM